MNLTVIASVVSVIAGFSLAWQLQAHQILKKELIYAQDRIATARASRQTLERVTRQIETAQANATVRGIHLRTELASAVNAGNGLRIQTKNSVLAAASDARLCSDTAATLGELLDSVSTERRELAEKADRHVIDIQALMERQAQ